MEGLKSIASEEVLGGRGRVSAVSVVFAANARPTAEDVRALAQRGGQFAVSFDPGAESGEASGWIELLANGLTFDCTGLAPAAVAELPERAHDFAIPSGTDFSSGEVITLEPGPHLAGGFGMFPVVRSLAWLGAMLAELPGAQAVSWHAARSYCAPGYYRTSVLRWIEGGAFPGLGLTALVATADGGLATEGLALFTGQELHLSPELAAHRSDGAKLALRLVHWLVENGGIAVSSQLTGPAGEPLLLEPQADQQIIKVYKSS